MTKIDIENILEEGTEWEAILTKNESYRISWNNYEDKFYYEQDEDFHYLDDLIDKLLAQGVQKVVRL